jgi:hypothetical protein
MSIVDNVMPKSLKKNKTVVTLVSVAIFIVIVIVVWKIYKGIKATSNVVGNALGNEVIAAQLGISTARVVYIRSEATRLWEKGVWSVFWIRNYNEEMFIVTINGMVSDKEVRLLDQLYSEASGERLRDVIDKSFTSSNKAKVNSQWLAVINS